jgi:hypothetical protein
MSLTLILGRCDSLRAEVFLRASLPAGVAPADAVITGTLKGPACRRAITLPVTGKFLTLPPDTSRTDSIVARVVLTEPSYWTPELPSLYQIDARLVVSGRENRACRRPVGLRRFGVRGRSLWLDGRRFVPRGLVMAERDIDVRQFRDALLTAMVADPSEAFLDACDAEGVPVIAILSDAGGAPMTADVARERIATWAWHATVLMAVVPVAARDDDRERIADTTRGTLLLAQEVDGSVPPPVVAERIDAFVVALEANTVPHPAWRTTTPAVPLMARRPDAAGATLSRQSCDILQASLAAWRSGAETSLLPWDWAGYCIDAPSQGNSSTFRVGSGWPVS